MNPCGLLLTQQVRQGRDGLEFQYWFSTDQGPLRYRVGGQQAVFFTLQAERQQVSELLQAQLDSPASWQLKPLALRDPLGRPVDGLYFNRLDAFYRGREQLQRFGVTLIEDDIRPAERYLMERFICGGLRINSGQWQSSQRRWSLAAAGAGQHGSRPVTFVPRLRVLSFDIETSMRGQELYSIGLYGVVADDAVGNVSEDKPVLARVLMRGAEAPATQEADNADRDLTTCPPKRLNCCRPLLIRFVSSIRTC